MRRAESTLSPIWPLIRHPSPRHGLNLAGSIIALCESAALPILIEQCQANGIDCTVLQFTRLVALGAAIVVQRSCLYRVSTSIQTPARVLHTDPKSRTTSINLPLWKSRAEPQHNHVKRSFGSRVRWPLIIEVRI